MPFYQQEKPYNPISSSSSSQFDGEFEGFEFVASSRSGSSICSIVNNGFKSPIFLTMCHMTACLLLSYVAIMWMKLVPTQKLRSRMQFLKMAALWVLFCISVVSGNMSLQQLPLSFTQAVGATSPFFTALVRVFGDCEAGGLDHLCHSHRSHCGHGHGQWGENRAFIYLGLFFCVVATAARAFKSVLQGTLLLSEGNE